MPWDDVAALVRAWDGPFCLKGVISVEDAERAVEIGGTGIILSNPLSGPGSLISIRDGAEPDRSTGHGMPPRLPAG